MIISPGSLPTSISTGFQRVPANAQKLSLVLLNAARRVRTKAVTAKHRIWRAFQAVIVGLITRFLAGSAVIIISDNNLGMSPVKCVNALAVVLIDVLAHRH